MTLSIASRYPKNMVDEKGEEVYMNNLMFGHALLIKRPLPDQDHIIPYKL